MENCKIKIGEEIDHLAEKVALEIEQLKECDFEKWAEDLSRDLSKLTD